MIMDDPDNNPDFYDWNHVYLPYLSGDIWLGNSEAKVNPWNEARVVGEGNCPDDSAYCPGPPGAFKRPQRAESTSALSS
jgi:hypothetical protein